MGPTPTDMGDEEKRAHTFPGLPFFPSLPSLGCLLSTCLSRTRLVHVGFDLSFVVTCWGLEEKKEKENK